MGHWWHQEGHGVKIAPVCPSLMEFTKLSPAIIAAASMSKKSDVVELLHNYDDSVSQTTTSRDHTYAILSLLKLLPCN